MEKEPFLVLKSSAGSGKTYALVRHFLFLSLKSEEAYAYSHILAITFTNAAASEMKERVMERLHEFTFAQALEGKNELFNDIRKELDVSPMILQERARKTLSHMLHNYSRLSISTIDSFTHRIVRAFAKDLQIHPDFSIEMDTDKFLEQCVDACLDEVGQDAELTTYLENYVLSNFEEEEDWNVRKGMISISKQLVKEDARNILQLFENLHISDYEKIKKAYQARLNELTEELFDRIDSVFDRIETSNLSSKDFFNGGNGTLTFLKKIRKGVFETPGAYFHKVLEKGWGKPKQTQVEALNPELNETGNYVLAWLEGNNKHEFNRINKILPRIFTTGLLSKLNEVSKRIKAEDNLLLISDFHAIVSAVVQESTAPFIYERAGERYQHILIDEFQDTSEMQWKNFLPLFENAIAQGKFNLVVGDGKQSIYRWRNGNVEQFVRLPKLYEGAPESMQHLIDDAYQEEVLNTNRRSGKAIIEFNNTLFGALKEKLGPLQDVYDKHEQACSKKHPGYVEVQTIVLDKKDSGDLHMLEGIVNAIRECREDGYEWGDIAILTRKGKAESTKISEFILQQTDKIPLTTEDSFLVQNSNEVQLLMACINFFGKETENFYRFNLIRRICDVFPDQFNYSAVISTYVEQLEKGKLKFKVNEFLDENYPGLRNIVKDNAHPFECIQELIRYFQLQFDVYLEFFENQLLQLSHRNGMGFSEMTDWWNDNKGKLYIQSGAQQNAVRILTIHKSKGLQFPVVIFPKFDTKHPNQTLWVQAPAVHPGFTKGLINFTPSKAPKPDNPEEILAENNKILLDDMNLLYVALTRPEDRLYFLTESKPSTTNSALNTYMYEYFKTHHGDMNKFHFGEKVKKEKGEEEEEKVIALLDGTRLNAVQPDFRMRETKRKDLEGKEALVMGNHLHACLSTMNQFITWQESLSNYIFEHTELQQSEKELLRQQVEETIGRDSFQQIFKTADEVLTEHDIQINAREVARPDRIHLGKNYVEVYDFKTGAEMEKHLQQVKNYMSALQAATNKTVRGYLAYTKTGTLKEVVL
jgi:ATP-dependent exoDNAse (exonuclease V) beta subunit